jgi:hypothetical protein
MRAVTGLLWESFDRTGCGSSKLGWSEDAQWNQTDRTIKCRHDAVTRSRAQTDDRADPYTCRLNNPV